MNDAARKLETEHAPPCRDCGVTTELHTIQPNGTDTGYLIQWECPECDPQRVQIESGLPDGFEVVSREDGQRTLTEALTDGGSPYVHEHLLDQNQPARLPSIAARLRDHVEALAPTKALWSPSDVLDTGEVLEYGDLALMTGSWPQPEWYNGSKVKRYVNPRYVHAAAYSDLRETCECGRVHYGYGKGLNMDRGPVQNHDPGCSPASQEEARRRLHDRRVAWLRKAGNLRIRQPVAKRRLGFESDKQASRIIRDLDETYFDWYGQGKTRAANTATILRGWGVDTQLIADAYGSTRQTVWAWKRHAQEPIVNEYAPGTLEQAYLKA